MIINPMIVLSADAPTESVPIYLGHSGEYNADSQSFDITALVEAYGDGTVNLKVQRKGDANPYVVIPARDGNIVTWTFSATDTSAEGSGWCQLLYFAGENVLKKTDVFRIVVGDSLGEAGEVPEPWEGFSDEMAALAAQAEASANAILDMTVSAHSVVGQPTVTKTEEEGVFNLDFGIPSGGGGGGGGELTEDVTSNLAVGAIPSGTTLTQGTTFTEFAKKLLITEIAPTIAFSISKSGNVKYGSSYTETLTVNVSAMGTAKSIDTIAWYEGNTLLQTDTISSTTTGSWSYTIGTATTNSTTFKAIITYKKSDNASTSVTKTASITFYYDKFYGVVDSLTPSEATIESLTNALATGRGGTYSFTTTASRICYAYPSSLGALTSIKDGNGFSLFSSFTRTTQNYTQNNTTVSYYLYVLTDPMTATGYSVTFA